MILRGCPLVRHLALHQVKVQYLESYCLGQRMLGFHFVLKPTKVFASGALCPLLDPLSLPPLKHYYFDV